MEDEHTIPAKSPPLNFLLFPISSSPFDFIHRTPFLSQPFLIGASNAVRDLQKSIDSNVDKCHKMVDDLSRQNGFLEKVLSFRSYVHSCSQIPFRKSRDMPAPNFAAILPGDTVAGIVVANGISNFLNIYNTLLIVRLVLTWFPNAPPAVVSPLSTLCDPYLNIFRGIIPPLGGTLDLSPILAFLVLNAFTSAAAALPAELPPARDTTPSHKTPSPFTTSQQKWMTRLAPTKAKSSDSDDI